MLSRTSGELEKTADEIRALGRRALALPADVTDLNALDLCLEKLRAELGEPTHLDPRRRRALSTAQAAASER